jgi:hypothetical protein
MENFRQELFFKQATIPAKNGLRIYCQCGYSWIYCGSSDRYASCPRCRSAVTHQPKREGHKDRKIRNKGELK